MAGEVSRAGLLRPVIGAPQRLPPPLHAGGTTSRRCAPSGVQSQSSLKTLAPTSGWATRFSRCRWVCQTVLHILSTCTISGDLPCAGGRACLAVADRPTVNLTAAASFLSFETVAGSTSEWLCVATRTVCLAPASIATRSSSSSQMETCLETGPAAHSCGTLCLPEVALLPRSASLRRGQPSCGRWTSLACLRMQLCCPRCMSTWASHWRLRGCSSRPASTTGGLQSLAVHVP